MGNVDAGDAGVVVGVDGSEASLAAVDWAAHVAAARGRVLTVALVVAGGDDGQVGLAADVADVLVERGRRVVGGARARAHAAQAGLRSRGLVVCGQPAARLRRMVGADDVLVVGSRGAGRFPRMLAGSTATQLAAYASCPVVLTRAAAAGFGRPVVVGVDGAGSAAAVEFAVEAAVREQVALLAVHAFTVPAGVVDGGGTGDAVLAGRVVAARLLEEAVGAWAEKFPELRLRREVVRGSAARALVEASRGASLVVVGARGSGGFPGLAVGSVAAHVLALAACPVAVVH